MKTKFLFPVISLVLIALIAFLATAVPDDPVPSIYEATLIPSCSAAGFENCEVVVGNMLFNLEVAEGETVHNDLLKFPLSPPAPEENAFFSREDILCDDPEMIGVAKYDEVSKKWVLLSKERQQPPEPYAARDGAYQISAQIGEPGIYAVVQKTQELVSAEDEAAGLYCKRRTCGTWRGFETFPESGKVNQGGEINLSFCNMFMGCDATGDGRCEPQCPEGTDPDCGVCTVGLGDCCDMTQGDGCDPDCWKINQNGKVVVGEPEFGDIISDSTDKDCISFAELYKVLEEDIEDEEEDDDVSLSHLFVPELAEERLMIWDIESELGYPVLLEGKISIRSAGASVPQTIILYDLFDKPYSVFTSRLGIISFPPMGIKKIGISTKKISSGSGGPWVNVTLNVHNDIDTDKPENADSDKDNFSNFDDCHDTNPFIFPGAIELENGMDDNCNSYNKYSDVAFNTVPNIKTQSPEGCGAGMACGVGTALATRFYTMPCKGYVQFTYINDVSYAEVWKQEQCSECVGDSCPASVKDQYDVKVKYCLGKTSNFYGPWHTFQALFAYGKDTDGFDCDDRLDISKVCAPDSLASCRIDLGTPNNCEGASYIGPMDRFNAWDRNAHRIMSNNEYETSMGYDEAAVYSEDLNTINSQERRVELLKGDIVYVAATGENQCTSDCDYGDVRFDVYCYQPIPPAEVPDAIDEGITAGERVGTTIHVCKTDHFDNFAQTCVDGEICSFETTTESGSCIYNVPSDEGYGGKPTYTYVCRKDGNCYKFYSSADDIRVCALSEQCSGVVNPELNIDLDCDGLTPYTPVLDESGAVVGIDRTKSLDPDCVDADITGDCDFENKKWYKSAEEGYVTDGYCQQCGNRDSTCTKSCEPGQKSCDGGCLQDTCDIAANKWCSAGSWTETGYCGKCGTLDEDYCPSVTCASAACDIVSNHTCYSSHWRDTRSSVAYCDVPACKAKDASCAATCEAGACDTYLNAYCKADRTWSANNADNYCAECGAVDADCGTGTCFDSHCDINEKKVCDGGIWKDSITDYCKKCDTVDEGSCLATCPPVEEWADTETNCTDGIDNDCMDGADCTDPVCKALDVCLNACPSFGITTGCGNNKGICTEGSHTCGMDGRWSECEDGRLPEIEICNGDWDDNCDGTIDEGCECGAGEKRVCGQDSGSCRAGTQTCSADGKWGYCYKSSRSSPTTEICGDGFDNDCDGEIDEDCPCDETTTQVCGGKEGTICKAGLQTCNDGLWGVCAGEIKPLTENSNTPGTCTDSIDNDCDGKIDADDDTCSVTPLDQLAPSCNDLKKNQDETGIDCGGKCPSCPTPGPATCNNKRMDGDEDGRDCGGSCSISCDEKLRTSSAPSDEDTQDDTTYEPVCGDAYCEDGEDCPDDCETASSLSGFLIPGIIILIIIGGAFAAYKAGFIKMKGKQQAKQSFPTPKGMPPPSQQPAKPSGAFKAVPQSAPRKEIKSKEEIALEKSFKEESELLKK